MKLICTIAAVTTFATASFSCAHAMSQVKPMPLTAAGTEAIIDQVIEQLHGVLRATKKPLPAWAVEIAFRAYTAWKTYKNGERVETIEKQLQITTLAVLREVADIKAIVGSGRDLTEAEYRRFRERLDGYGQRLDAHEAMINELQQQHDRLRAEIEQAKLLAAEQRRRTEAQGRQAEILKRKVEYRICGAAQVNDRQGNCVLWNGQRPQR